MSNLTAKELTALEDQLYGEEVLVKKYKTLASQCTDPAIKARLENVAEKHQGHYDRLTTYLK